MYTIVLILAIAAVVSANPDKGKCCKLFRPETMKCCPKITPDFDALHSDIRECLETPSNPHSCDREICIATKKGFLSGTSSFDKDALLSILEKDYADQADLLQLIKEKCVDADLDKYGHPDMCDLMKLTHCMKINLLASCPEWTDTGDCSGMKELVEECEKMST